MASYSTDRRTCLVLKPPGPDLLYASQRPRPFNTRRAVSNLYITSGGNACKAFGAAAIHFAAGAHCSFEQTYTHNQFTVLFKCTHLLTGSMLKQ